MEQFQKLNVWVKAHSMVLEVYRATKSFPPTEKYGMQSQVRRAMVSVAANIVEGARRKTINDRRHFFVIAQGSIEEVKYFLILVKDLGYLKVEQADILLEGAREVGRMLHGLIQSLER